MACRKEHSELQKIMEKLPVDQGGRGRHKCAACAYEAGVTAGYNLCSSLNLDAVFDNLEESQAKAQRHRSPHAAFALGYYNGVCQRLKEGR